MNNTNNIIFAGIKFICLIDTDIYSRNSNIYMKNS